MMVVIRETAVMRKMNAEKQGDDGEATMEELGSDDDDDFDLDGFDDDFDDYGDGNREE